jgi:hypothetical protein
MRTGFFVATGLKVRQGVERYSGQPKYPSD